MPKDKVESCRCKSELEILELKVAKLSEDAVIPRQALPGDAGYDIFSNEDVTIAPWTRATIGSGCRVKVQSGRVGMVCPRSGLSSKFGVTVANAPGILDSGYTGELKVILANYSDSEFCVKKGDKIAQLVIPKFESPLTKEISNEDMDSLNTVRGSNGFGSTGK